jgi:hypothetical protein
VKTFTTFGLCAFGILFGLLESSKHSAHLHMDIEGLLSSIVLSQVSYSLDEMPSKLNPKS